MLYAPRPWNLTAVASNSAIVLNWTDASASPDLFFSVRRQAENDRPIVLARTADTTWTDATAEPGIHYSYVVVASDLPFALSNRATCEVMGIPALNSDPGAPATLYLDFHGEPAFSLGFSPIPATPAYDIDGDPTTFSGQELANIQEICSRVSEMYSPFNINVTTVDPGNWGVGGQHQLRALIGGNGSWAGSGYAGVAQEDSYTESYLGDTVFSFSAVMSGNPTYVPMILLMKPGMALGCITRASTAGPRSPPSTTPAMG